MIPCDCTETHVPRRVVVTGGPGAGKTAALELIRRSSFCKHLQILPESAGIVFGGGFPRRADVAGRKAAQRAIFYVQRELEEASIAGNPAIVLCDRGTVDGAAYWPGPEDYFAAVNTTLAEQISRYDAVIHLRTPRVDGGYNHQNPLRTETAIEAAEVDLRILRVWDAHPRRFIVDATPDFLAKAARVLELLRAELPECCRHHVVPVLDERIAGAHIPATAA
jgi:predicted ATPase